MTTDTDTQEIAVDEWLDAKGITFSVIGHGAKIDKGWLYHSYTANFQRDGRNRLSVPYKTGMLFKRDVEAIGVLYSLLLDGQAGKLTFDEFVADSGYDVEDPEDESRVRAIHRACQSLGKQMGKFFTDDEITELEELTQDY